MQITLTQRHFLVSFFNFLSTLLSIVNINRAAFFRGFHQKYMNLLILNHVVSAYKHLMCGTRIKCQELFRLSSHINVHPPPDDYYGNTSVSEDIWRRACLDRVTVTGSQGQGPGTDTSRLSSWQKVEIYEAATNGLWLSPPHYQNKHTPLHVISTTYTKVLNSKLFYNPPFIFWIYKTIN